MGFNIGNVKIEGFTVLAPMAGVTDLPFRRLCKESGAGLVCMEMVSAKAITYNNKKTFDLMRIDNSERPVSLQIFGSNPEVIYEAVKRMGEIPFDILDFNMGCPMPKVVNNGEGSALMKDEGLARRVLSALVKASDRPVTLKIRKGFDDSNINAVEIAKIAEDTGISAIAVHGRTREQYYSGKADWDIIRAVKSAISIPVIGNGDVNSPQAAKEMIEKTGCDAVMIGRGAQGNPWIFGNINAYLERGEVLPPPTFEQVRDMLIRHTKLQVEYKGEVNGIREMRKHAAWYMTGMQGAANFRRMVNDVTDMEGMIRITSGL